MEEIVIKVVLVILGGGGLTSFGFWLRPVLVAYINRHKGRSLTIKGVDAKGKAIEFTLTDHTALEESALLEQFRLQSLTPVRVQRGRMDSNGSALQDVLKS